MSNDRGQSFSDFGSNPVYTVCILGGPQPYTYEVGDGPLGKREEP